MADSKHAAQLRSLGFKLVRINETELQRVVNEMGKDAGLPPPDVTKPQAAEEPFFCTIGPMTIARDEHGQRWLARGRIDLSAFGFRDDTQHINTFIELLMSKEEQRKN